MDKKNIEGGLDKTKGKIKDVAGNVREGIKDKLDDLDRPKDDRNP